MSSSRRTWRAKFANAFHGVAQGVRGQSSFAVHGAATLLVVAAGWWLDVARWEWGLLALCVGLVWVAEMTNSALESLAAAVTQEHDHRVGLALDMASGAVLLAALTAVVVGMIVLLGHLG